MKLLAFVVSALLVSSLAGPVREKRETDLEELLETIKMFKDPETYDSLKELSEMFKMFGDMGQDVAPIEGEDTEVTEFVTKLFGKFEEGLKVVYELAKSTLVDGAKPTDEKLAELAKKFSKVVRENHLRFRDYGNPKNTMMTNETIELLKQIAVEKPAKVSGNNYLDAIKEKIPKLHIVANRINNVNDHIRKAIKEYDQMKLPTATEAEEKAMARFMFEYVFDEMVDLFKSEETATVLFKNLGVIIDTLKNPASYESLQALHNNLARSKRVESHAILMRELCKCFGAELTPEERATWREHFAKALPIAKVVLADGQDTSKAQEMVKNFKENDLPVLAQLYAKMKAYDNSVEGRKRFRQCLVKEDDRKVYKEAMALPGPIFTEEQLNGIRAKNEKVYAFVQNLNSGMEFYRRHQGLGPEADAFVKEMLSTPNMLLFYTELFNPSQETLDKVNALKQMAVDKYNALPVEAKKQMVDAFPYRTFVNMAITG